MTNIDPCVKHLEITWFSSHSESNGIARVIQFNDLCDFIETSAPIASRKDALPLIKLATFAGNRRSNETLSTVYGIEGDYDAGTVQPERAAELLRIYGLRAIVLTTPSHRPDAPRWRILAPLSAPTTPTARRELVGRLNAILGGTLAPESFVPSQAFYLGTVHGGHPLQSWRSDGRCIDEFQIDAVYPTASVISEGGQRQALGDPSLAAPSFDWAYRALLAINPNDLDRHDWMKATAAFKSAAWPHTDEATIRATWDVWCGHYAQNNPTENAKLWHSLQRTEAGWEHLLTASGLRQEYETGRAVAAFQAAPLPASDRARGDGALIYFRDDWFTYRDGHYQPTEVHELRRHLYNGQNMTKKRVDEAIDLLKAQQLIGRYDVQSLPHWIKRPNGMPPASELIVLKNGLLHVETGRLHPLTSDLLTFNALPYSFEPNAPTPHRWLNFMDEVFAHDAETIREFQKMIGYFLTGDTSLQKIFLLKGERRSGKGTIGRVINNLIGRSNIAGIGFNDLGESFGMQSLIGKQLAIVSDARLGRWADTGRVAENLLRISGEDEVNVNRKNREAWNGKLNVKFMIMSNETPIVQDASGALVGRYVCFETKQSFYGREDRQLDDALQAELPGIMRWALDGLLALKQDGRIETPSSARAVIRDATRISAPVRSFVEECCTFKSEAETPKQALYAAFVGWWDGEGLGGAPVAENWFHRQFRASYAGRVRIIRPRFAGMQVRGHEVYSGITVAE